jgi:pimeloyl-ACP methyl ester carboxylesterase
MSEPKRDYLTVDGIKLYRLSAGSGEPVFLLHGLGASSYSWRGVLPLLSRNYSLHAFDWPGFGRSDKPDDFDYSPAGLSRILLGTMDALGIKRARLVGNSMGGLVSLWTAMAEPERVEKLALLGTPFYPSDKPKLLWPMRWPVIGSLYEAMLGEWAVGFIAKGCFVDQSLITEELKQEYALALKEAGGRRAIAQFVRGAMPPDALERVKRYPSIKTPILVIHGEKDWIDPASPKRFAAEVPAARLRMLAACGHAPQEEKPEAVSAELEGFLA